ncbi:MAG TPA: alpha-L-fucosidase [Terriglobia bacterium]|nr:alpha-L-fucosidase [Terriglobia bacterium]
MNRRTFVTHSLMGNALLGLGPTLASTPDLGPAQATVESQQPDESRFQELKSRLDFEAMQRGWAKTVDPDYHHAPAESVEAFQDLKFGIRVHWGLYSMIGSHESWGLAGANREFWNIYNILYQFFNPIGFDAEAWMNLFERSGIKFFTLTTKHHDGFSLWPTKTQQQSIRLTPQAFNYGAEHFETIEHSYSVLNAPYRKDIVRAVVDAARRKGIGVGLYFSHIDWHDPAFAWDPFNENYDPSFTEQSDPVRWRTFIAHERQQLQELMTQYGRIDYLDFDIGWPQAAAPDIANLAKMVRKLQPNVIMRDRGIGAYGDYHTPEREIPGKPTPGLWKVIYPCGEAFSYLPNDRYKSKEWILDSLIDITAKGGNFEVGFGPMPNGTWPQETVDHLEFVGNWLRVSGEAIYATRPWTTDREGGQLRFTRSKDGKYVFAISLKPPQDTLTIKSLRAAPGSPIVMLGSNQPLKWSHSTAGLVIEMDHDNATGRNTDWPCAFKIQVE